MMKFIYGGDVTGVPVIDGKPAPNNGVEMSVVSLDGITREAHYDPTGVDYLYTEWDISCIVIVSPNAISYATKQPQQLITVSNSAIATDMAIRPILMAPRRRLTISFLSAFNEQQVGAAAEEVLIDVPTPNTSGTSQSLSAGNADARLGPTPTKCNIIGPSGNGECLLYDFGIKFWVNEANNFFGNPNSKPPLLLSNRWTMTRQINRDGELAAYETTRLIQGSAIFRTDRMLEALACPDQFSRTLLHPVPLGFQRIACDVAAIPDATGVEYSIVDQQVPISLIAQNTPGVVKISAQHKKLLIKKW